MRAIRIRARAAFTVHALESEAKTMCGRKVADLEIVDRLELESLPSFEGCRSCLRVLNGWTRADRVRGLAHPTAEPQAGRLRTTGPLRHGTGISRGARRLR